MVVSGIALESAQSLALTSGNSVIENFTIDTIGVPVEMRVWQNSGTKDLYMTLETCFGITAADAAAAAWLDHA